LHRTSAIHGAPLVDLLPMRTQNELDRFATESEIVTGPAGRTFMVAGADGPAFRVRFDEAGYLLQHIERKERPVARAGETATGLADQALGDAMASGRRCPNKAPRLPLTPQPISGELPMSTPQQCIGRIDTPYGSATIVVGRYPAGGAIAIQLVDDDEPMEPIATFSTNLVPYGATVANDEFCVKTWSENEDLVSPMLSTGLFKDTGKRVPSGHVVSPVWRILDPANVPPAFGRGSTASQAAAAYAVR